MRSTSSAGVVVVGGGPAGWSCAFALRERGYNGAITCVCEEPRSAYDRTMVSKDCLDRVPDDDELLLSAEAAYVEADVTLCLGTAATSLDVDRRTMTLSDGAVLGYEALVIATGGRPWVPPALACPGVHVLRNLADAERLAEALATVERVVIVGGGFIAGEVATTAVARGLEVIMLEALEAPLARVVGVEVGAVIARLHREAGVDVHVRAMAERVLPLGDEYVVELRDGAAMSAHAVVVATGMTPAIQWLEGTPGLTLDGGVVTDDCCRTGVPDVYAAGDCARWWNRQRRRLSRVEHWDTAIRHGKAVAASIMGAPEPFVPVPFVWSMQQGSRLQWVGDGSGWDRVEIHATGPGPGLTARYHHGGEFCAGFAIDDPRAIGAMRRELADLYSADVVAAE